MQPELIPTIAAVFATVALLTGSVTSLTLSRLAPERRRLRHMASPRKTARPQPEKLRLAEGPSPRLQRLQGMLPSANDPMRLRRRLAAAGYDDYAAAVLFSAAQIALPVAGALAALLLLGFQSGWIAALLVAVVAYVLPDAWLTRQTVAHRRAIQDGLPDALDLIVVCVEAGSSLDQAIMKASAELEIALPAIAQELKTVATETRAGKPRLEAFQDLAKRSGVEDIRALVAMLIQTDRFGTSISQSLRTHAETSRTKRRQRAEEKASTVGVKLVFPLVLCLVPALYVVCLGPVLVTMLRQLL